MGKRWSDPAITARQPDGISRMSPERALRTCPRCLEVVLPARSPGSDRRRFQAKFLPCCLPMLPHPCARTVVAEQRAWMEPFPLNSTLQPAVSSRRVGGGTGSPRAAQKTQLPQQHRSLSSVCWDRAPAGRTCQPLPSLARRRSAGLVPNHVAKVCFVFMERGHFPGIFGGSKPLKARVQHWLTLAVSLDSSSAHACDGFCHPFLREVTQGVAWQKFPSRNSPFAGVLSTDVHKKHSGRA